MSGEAYFSYVDLHLEYNAGADDIVVRVAMGQTDVYEAGDVLVNTGAGFNWVSNVGSTLTPVTSTRPGDAEQYADLASFTPFYDGGSSDLTVLDKLALDTDLASEALSVSQDTKKLVVDVDFSAAGVTASDTSSAATIAQTIDIPFFASGSLSSVTATVTPLSTEQVGGGDDPAPTLGNGE